MGPDQPLPLTTWPDGSRLADALAGRVASCLEAALCARDAASLVVSGGRTPVPFFEALRARDLDWSKVTITLADERWVDASHPDSNEGLVRRHLLQGLARTARFIPLKGPEGTAEEGQAACERRLLALPRPLDVVVLGMGADAHFASLFPDAPEIRGALRAERTCVPVRPASAPCVRMSLTPWALRDSRIIVLHATGDSKRRALERALQPGPIHEMPVRWLLQDDSPTLEIWWAPE